MPYREVLAAIGYLGMSGFMASVTMICWHFWRIARLGRVDLLVNDFRFFDRASHPPAVRPHVGAIWWWAGAAAIGFVLFAVGATSL